MQSFFKAGSMSNQPPLLSMLPLTQEQLNKLQDVTKDLTPAQFAWLSGYFWGQLNQHSSTKDELVNVQNRVPQHGFVHSPAHL